MMSLFLVLGSLQFPGSGPKSGCPARSFQFSKVLARKSVVTWPQTIYALCPASETWCHRRVRINRSPWPVKLLSTTSQSASPPFLYTFRCSDLRHTCIWHCLRTCPIPEHPWLFPEGLCGVCESSTANQTSSQCKLINVHRLENSATFCIKRNILVF